MTGSSIRAAVACGFTALLAVAPLALADASHAASTESTTDVGADGATAAPDEGHAATRPQLAAAGLIGVVATAGFVALTLSGRHE